MKNLTPELITKAKAAKSAEELLELAKENDVELTEDEAKTCFEQLHANSELSDDELEAVSGGGICEVVEAILGVGERVKTINGNSAPFCGGTPGKIIDDVMPLPHDSNDRTKIERL